MWLILITAAAFGAGLQTEQKTVAPFVGHPVFDLRVGADGVGQGQNGVQPYLCGEIAPIRLLSIEGCGNGSGIFHGSNGPDMAHFRLRGRVLEHQGSTVDAALLLGAGFTEVQRTADKVGFQFGNAVEGQIEAAGPEVSVGLKARHWLGKQSYVVGDVTAGGAYIAGAPTVMGWSSPLIPFASVTIGMGI